MTHYEEDMYDFYYELKNEIYQDLYYNKASQDEFLKMTPEEKNVYLFIQLRKYINLNHHNKCGRCLSNLEPNFKCYECDKELYTMTVDGMDIMKTV